MKRLPCAFVCFCVLGICRAQTIQELDDGGVAGLVRSASKSIYVRTHGSIPEPIFSELAIRHNFYSRRKQFKGYSGFTRVQVMTGDARPLMPLIRADVPTWVNEKHQAMTEILVIDEAIVVTDFNSDKPEIIHDPLLAANYARDLRKGRKLSDKIYNDARERVEWWVPLYHFLEIFGPALGGRRR